MFHLDFGWCGKIGMEAQFWLNLQLSWDLYHLIHSPAAKRIQKIKRLPALESVAPL